MRPLSTVLALNQSECKELRSEQRGIAGFGPQNDEMRDPQAVLFLSFGGPNQLDDVMPFLRNVTTGRNVPDERLAIVAEQYEMFGGRSPINDQNRALIVALREEMATHGIDLPIYFGNRNWEPYVGQTVQQMRADGIERALVFVTSAFGSYSGCRQYRENLTAAIGEHSDIELQKLRLFYNHPGFIEPAAANVKAAITQHSTPPRVVFTAHSIPDSMAASCDYLAQLTEAAQLVVDQLDPSSHSGHDLVFQSRSGPPQIPWLEPDVNDHLEQLAERDNSAPVTLVPLGFISDHMEVMFDLDTQAVATAERLGLTMNRAHTVGVDARFVTMIRELIEEQTNERPRLSLGSSGPWPDHCPEGHCLAPQRPAGAGRPS